MTTTNLTQTSNTCTISNALAAPDPAPAQGPQHGWDGGICLISAFDATDSGAEDYQDALVLLPFSGGGTTLAAGATDTITLDLTAPDATQITLYGLICAQPDNWFPVTIVTAAQHMSNATSTDTAGNKTRTTTFSYPPITLGPQDQPSPTLNAWLFYQSINADPSSPMAQQFAQAGNAATANAQSSGDIEDATAAFFATTPYGNVTLPDYSLVTTYLATFATPWANFESSYTYYLTRAPSADGKGNTGGRIEFVRQSGPVPLTDATGATNTNAGYSITFYEQNSGDDGALRLYFVAGQLLSSRTDPAPAVCLQTGYASLASFSGETADWSSIVPTLSGRVGSTDAVGVSWRPRDDEDTTQKIQAGLSWAWKQHWMQDFMALTGLIMGINLVWEGLAWIGGKLRRKEADGPVAPEDVQGIRDAAEEHTSDRQAEDQTRLDQVGGQGNQVPAPQDLQTAQQGRAQQAGERANQGEIDMQQARIDRQESDLEADAGFGVSADMNKASSQLQQEQRAVNSEDPDAPNFKTEAQQTNAQIKQGGTQVQQVNTEEVNRMNTQQKETVQRQQEINDQMTEERADMQDDRAKQTEKDGALDRDLGEV